MDQRTLFLLLFSIVFLGNCKKEAPQQEIPQDRQITKILVNGETYFEFFYDPTGIHHILEYIDNAPVWSYDFVYDSEARPVEIIKDLLTLDAVGYRHYKITYDNQGRLSGLIRDSKIASYTNNYIAKQVSHIRYIESGGAEIEAIVDTLWIYPSPITGPDTSITVRVDKLKNDNVFRSEWTYHRRDSIHQRRCRNNLLFDERKNPFENEIVRYLFHSLYESFTFSRNNVIEYKYSYLCDDRYDAGVVPEIEYNDDNYPIEIVYRDSARIRIIEFEYLE